MSETVALIQTETSEPSVPTNTVSTVDCYPLPDADLFSSEPRPFFPLPLSIRLLSRGVCERVPINRRALTSVFNGCRYLGAPHRLMRTS